MTENMPDEIKLIDNKLKELEENTDYKEIKEKLDKGNNFIDYFLIIGLEPDIYKNDWFFNEDLESMKEKYKEEITPKIISSFPNFQKSTIAFDDSILIHCFPNKYELIKSKTKPKQKLFSFILDNNYYNLNYPQKYLTCLICYESIVQYKILSEIDKNPDIDLKSMDRKNITSSIKDPEIYIPKCLLIMSLYPYFGEFEKIITEIYNYSLNLVFQPIDQNPLPKMKEMFRHSNRKISFRKMSTFAEVKKDKEVNVPIEKIIENLLIELPVPPRGVTTVKYFLNEEERTIKQNEMNELPLLDVNLKIIFLDFEIKDIITIYNYIFLESRILFFSKNIEILNNYIYGLLALLYPFQYQYQIVTILPEQNFEIIESITPFIAGINKSYEEDFFVKNNFVLSDCIMVVDIDKGKIDIVNKNDETIPEFPSKYRKNIEKKLQDITFKYFKKKSNSKNIRKSKLLSNSILEQKKEGVSTVQTFSYSTNETLDSNKSMILTQKETLNSIMEESNLLEDDNNNAPIFSGLAQFRNTISNSFNNKKMMFPKLHNKLRDTIAIKDQYISEVKVAGKLPVPYLSAIKLLTTLKKYKAPFEKIVIIAAISDQITESATTFWSEMEKYIKKDFLSIEADEIMAIFLFIVIRSQMPEIIIFSKMITNFTTPGTRAFSIAYNFTLLEASLEYLSSIRNLKELIKDDSKQLKDARKSLAGITNQCLSLLG